ncbi:unnamed protein product [Amoebophrya sp. A120]|nr:unnamed protein product [Amoebophrya sp. A120]|eukprot:GSA120T00012037001.1
MASPDHQRVVTTTSERTTADHRTSASSTDKGTAAFVQALADDNTVQMSERMSSMICWAGAATLIGVLIGLLYAIADILVTTYRPCPEWFFSDVGVGSVKWHSLHSGVLVLGGVVVALVVSRLVPAAGGAGMFQTRTCVAFGERVPARVGAARFVLTLLYVGSGHALEIRTPFLHIGGAVASKVYELAQKTAGTRIFPDKAGPTGLVVLLGSVAGFACAFNSPFGGLLFAIEEYRFFLGVSNILVPLVACSAIVSVTSARWFFSLFLNRLPGLLQIFQTKFAGVFSPSRFPGHPTPSLRGGTALGANAFAAGSSGKVLQLGSTNEAAGQQFANDPTVLHMAFRRDGVGAHMMPDLRPEVGPWLLLVLPLALSAALGAVFLIQGTVISVHLFADMSAVRRAIVVSSVTALLTPAIWMLTDTRTLGPHHSAAHHSAGLSVVPGAGRSSSRDHSGWERLGCTGGFPLEGNRLATTHLRMLQCEVTREGAAVLSAFVFMMGKGVLLALSTAANGVGGALGELIVIGTSGGIIYGSVLERIGLGGYIPLVAPSNNNPLVRPSLGLERFFAPIGMAAMLAAFSRCPLASAAVAIDMLPAGMNTQYVLSAAILAASLLGYLVSILLQPKDLMQQLLEQETLEQVANSRLDLNRQPLVVDRAQQQDPGTVAAGDSGATGIMTRSGGSAASSNVAPADHTTEGQQLRARGVGGRLLSGDKGNKVDNYRGGTSNDPELLLDAKTGQLRPRGLGTSSSSSTSMGTSSYNKSRQMNVSNNVVVRSPWAPTEEEIECERTARGGTRRSTLSMSSSTGGPLRRAVPRSTLDRVVAGRGPTPTDASPNLSFLQGILQDHKMRATSAGAASAGSSTTSKNNAVEEALGVIMTRTSNDVVGKNINEGADEEQDSLLALLGPGAQVVQRLQGSSSTTTSPRMAGDPRATDDSPGAPLLVLQPGQLPEERRANNPVSVSHLAELTSRVRTGMTENEAGSTGAVLLPPLDTNSTTLRDHDVPENSGAAAAPTQLELSPQNRMKMQSMKKKLATQATFGPGPRSSAESGGISAHNSDSSYALQILVVFGSSGTMQLVVTLLFDSEKMSCTA